MRILSRVKSFFSNHALAKALVAEAVNAGGAFGVQELRSVLAERGIQISDSDAVATRDTLVSTINKVL